MKRLFSIFMILIFAYGSAYAAEVDEVLGAAWAGGGEASCDTAVDDCSGSASANIGIAIYPEHVYVATVITGDGSTICKVCAELYAVGSPDYELIATFYTDSSGPSSPHGTVSSSVEANTISPTDTAGATSSPTCFEFPTPPTLTNTTPYYFVIYTPDGDQPNTDYIAWNRGDCDHEDIYNGYAGPADWELYSDYKGCYFFMYKE
jgi:hypothetical protein